MPGRYLFRIPEESEGKQCQGEDAENDASVERHNTGARPVKGTEPQSQALCTDAG